MDLSKELLKIKEERDKLIRQMDIAKAKYEVIWQQLNKAGIKDEKELEEEIEKLKEEISEQKGVLQKLIQEAKEMLGI